MVFTKTFLKRHCLETLLLWYVISPQAFNHIRFPARPRNILYFFLVNRRFRLNSKLICRPYRKFLENWTPIVMGKRFI